MRKKIYSLLVVFSTLLCLILFFIVFIQSTRYANNKVLFNAKFFNNHNDLEFQLDSSGNIVNQAPDEIELYLRSKLLTGNLSSEENKKISESYKALLSRKPSWPYFYSGLAQIVEGVNKKQVDIEKTIKYGPHESKLTQVVAEFLFSKWSELPIVKIKNFLFYIANQSDYNVSRVVKVSTKFAKLYEFCDFLYDKRQVENAACTKQYWRPLSINK